jgi:hypothetical protein
MQEVMNTKPLSYKKIIAICRQRRFLMKTGRSYRPQAQLEAALERVETFLTTYPQVSDENLRQFIIRKRDDILQIIPSNQTHIRSWVCELQ